jgi:hypothetical protein
MAYTSDEGYTVRDKLFMYANRAALSSLKSLSMNLALRYCQIAESTSKLEEEILTLLNTVNACLEVCDYFTTKQMSRKNFVTMGTIEISTSASFGSVDSHFTSFKSNKNYNITEIKNEFESMKIKLYHRKDSFIDTVTNKNTSSIVTSLTTTSVYNTIIDSVQRCFGHRKIYISG